MSRGVQGYLPDGTALGDAVGGAVGAAVGTADGEAVGAADGFAVGVAEGAAVGGQVSCEQMSPQGWDVISHYETRATTGRSIKRTFQRLSFGDRDNHLGRQT